MNWGLGYGTCLEYLANSDLQNRSDTADKKKKISSNKKSTKTKAQKLGADNKRKQCALYIFISFQSSEAAKQKKTGTKSQALQFSYCALLTINSAFVFSKFSFMIKCRSRKIASVFLLVFSSLCIIAFISVVFIVFNFLNSTLTFKRSK